jgi:hypothetical protein
MRASDRPTPSVEIHGPPAKLPRLLMAALGIVLTLLLLEGIARIEGPTVCADEENYLLHPDAELGWTFRPGLTLTLDPCDGAAWSAPVTINDSGLADQEWPLEKRAKETRVLLLGGQLADGIGVARRDRLSVRLAHLADQRRGQRVSVINGQIPGYSMARQETFLEKRGLAFDPDIVVLVLDPVGAHRDEGTIGLAQTLPPAGGLLSSSAIHAWWTGRPATTDQRSARLFPPPTLRSPEETKEAQAQVLSGIRSLAQRAREAGVGFAILVAPPCPETPYPTNLCEDLKSIAPCMDLGGSFASIRNASTKPPELCIDGLGRWGRDGHFLASHALWTLLEQSALWPQGVVRGYRL